MINERTETPKPDTKNPKKPKTVKADRRMPHCPNDRELQIQMP